MITETAEKSVSTLKKILDLKTTIEKNKIINIGKRAPKALILLHALFKKPVVTGKDVQSITELSQKAANELIKVFIKEEIIIESTGYKRNKVFVFKEYINMFL